MEEPTTTTVAETVELTGDLAGAIVIPLDRLPPGSTVSVTVVIGAPAAPAPDPAPAPARRYLNQS